MARPCGGTFDADIAGIPDTARVSKGELWWNSKCRGAVPVGSVKLTDKLGSSGGTTRT